MLHRVCYRRCNLRQNVPSFFFFPFIMKDECKPNYISILDNLAVELLINDEHTTLQSIR
jgi:hypothetical protein